MAGAGTFTKLFSLPADRRFSTLAEAPNGKLYTSVFRNNGSTELWTLDMSGGRRPAKCLKGLITASGCTNPTCPPTPVNTTWYHGIQSLIVTPEGQLLAHGDLEYILPDSLYEIHVATGLMTEIASIRLQSCAGQAGRMRCRIGLACSEALGSCPILCPCMRHEAGLCIAGTTYSDVVPAGPVFCLSGN